MRQIPEELLRRPFTTATAAAYGVTARQLEGARYVRLFHGVHACRVLEITLEVLAQAISLVLPPGAVISKSTASRFHDADVRRLGDLDLDVTTLRGSVIRRHGLRVCESYLEPGDVVEIHGIPVTSPIRTTFDLARDRSLIERVVGVDAMLNRGGCRLDDLAAYIDDRPSWWGIRWAREALVHAEPLAESPMESRQRMRFVLAGLPRPTAQYELFDSDGLFVARLDHAFERWKVGPEYDGGVHAKSWRYDNERQERIRGADWWHRRYTSLSIDHGWEAMVNEVGRALYERGWRP